MIEIYDNGGETFDRYTVIIDGDVYGMSANPNSPQGFNQYSGTLAELPMARSNGERITMESLPEEVQKAIEARSKSTNGPLIQSNFKCPNCEIGMEYREHELSESKEYPSDRKTHAWICPDCPIVCFEYWTNRDIDALYKIIK